MVKMLELWLLNLLGHAYAESRPLEKVVKWDVRRGERHRLKRWIRDLRIGKCLRVLRLNAGSKKWLERQGRIVVGSRGVVGIKVCVCGHVGSGDVIRVVGGNGSWRSVIIIGRGLAMASIPDAGRSVAVSVHVCGGDLILLVFLKKFDIVGEVGVETKFVHLNLGLRRIGVFGRRKFLIFCCGNLICQQSPGQIGTWDSRSPAWFSY